MMSWLGETWAILSKEWRCELRSRYALSTVLLFAITTLIAVSISVGPAGATPEQRPLMPVLLWLILLFAATAGLPRTFVHEEETHTADPLRLAARPSCLFCGKTLYNLTLLLVLEAVVTPLFLVLLQVEVADLWSFAIALLVGGVGLAVGSTLIAAMVAQARARGPLFAVLAFPILLPLLKLVIDASFVAVAGEAQSPALGLAVLYDSMVTVASLMLFPVVWNP
ncbi:MAG: heme exporter protein CcmB [Thermoanaerobaculia bacterium]|nr:heme exporter protein CcmB [Thermoanaerobaculia bacterium]